MTEQEFDDMSGDYAFKLFNAINDFCDENLDDNDRSDYNTFRDVLYELKNLHFNQSEPLTISQMTKRTHKIRQRLNDFDNELQVLYQEVQRIKWELDGVARGMCEEYERKVKESKDEQGE